MGMRLTESRVRTKLSTSIERVAPSLAFSSATFLGRAIVMEVVMLALGLMIWRVGSLKKPERRRLKEFSGVRGGSRHLKFTEQRCVRLSRRTDRAGDNAGTGKARSTFLFWHRIYWQNI
jgi:hypothetical protein